MLTTAILVTPLSLERSQTIGTPPRLCVAEKQCSTAAQAVQGRGAAGDTGAIRSITPASILYAHTGSIYEAHGRLWS